MKSFQLFVKQLDQWRRARSAGTTSKLCDSSEPNRLGSTDRSRPTLQSSVVWQRIAKLKPEQLTSQLFCPIPKRRKPSSGSRVVQSGAMFTLAVLSLTSAIGYRFYNEPQLAVDTVSPMTLRAPESASVVDTKTTEQSRTAARMGAVPVLMIDQSVNQKIYQALQRLLDEGDMLRQRAGTFPFVSTSTLSTTTQQYLRQAPEWEWRTAIVAAEGNGLLSQPSPSGTAASATRESAASQQLAILELQTYRRASSAEDFAALKQIINRNRQTYASTLKLLAEAPKGEPRSFHNADLFNLTDVEWLEAKVETRRILERILTQGVAPGLPDNLLENAIRLHTNTDISPAIAPLISRMLIATIEANLVEDPNQTRLRAEQAAQAVDPVVVEIRRGELIVDAGEVITQSDFVLLDHFGMSQRGVNWIGLIGFSALIGGGVALFLVVERRYHPGLRRRDYILITLLVLTTPLMVALSSSATSLPAVGLLVGSFYGSTLGVAVVGLLSLLLPIGMEISSRHLISSVAGSLVGAIMAGRLRSREELAVLGGAVGLTQGVVYLILSLIVSTSTSPVWYAVLTAAALQGLIGVGCSIVALGISPYLEQLFDLVTPIRLAELANPNRPLLKRLASEAAGTFQHTLFVATLAEAAARALRCNVELVRAGTLYHDIGKMHDAQGFIENQMGGPNKHDLIDNPWKSAEIIKKHVSEGLVLARRYRLPKAIQAFIPEHQGTMLIAYFYHEAQQRAKADSRLSVNEAEFRYEGPIPQSRETGIVMLADSCEAALRSLKNATPEEALAMINRILRARWQDNQMIESGLSRDEMTQIAEIFVKVWQQFNHQRIAYPKLGAAPQPSPAK